MSSKTTESKLFVGQLSKKIRTSDLADAFSKYGKVKDIELKTNHAFVEFDSARDAEEAADEMDGKTIVDSKITVQFKGNLVLKKFHSVFFSHSRKIILIFTKKICFL